VTIGDPRLIQAADRSEIADQIARLAFLGDEGDLQSYHDVYTADASWLHPSGDLHGRDRIVESAQARRSSGRTGPGSGTRHVITTVSVSFSGADEAIAESYFLAYAHTDSAPALQSMGHYHDEFRRETGGWRIARRTISPG
jgi:3-phenylpropionate/cinnamic acid dioxygenase small subunit